MAKAKIKAPSIRDIVPMLKNGKEPLPIYYFFGEDKFAIEKATELIVKTYSKFVESDFDKEIIHADKSMSANQIVELASAFPFGSGKKIVVVKYFNLIKDKKELTEYVKNPSEFTILILLDDGNSVNMASNPFKALKEKGYIFEARRLSGAEWFAWIKSRAKDLGLTIDSENAQRLFEIVGEENRLLMRQLEKIRDYLGENGVVTKEVILKLASPTKTYTTFELQDAFLRGDKSQTLKIGYHLLDNGLRLFEILPMLSSAIYILTQNLELKNRRELSPKERATAAGAHPFYYGKVTASRFFTTEEKIKNAARALLEADLAVKTSGGKEKTIFLQLVSRVFE